jgi:hypothetical protein
MICANYHYRITGLAPLLTSLAPSYPVCILVLKELELSRIDSLPGPFPVVHPNLLSQKEKALT